MKNFKIFDSFNSHGLHGFFIHIIPCNPRHKDGGLEAARHKDGGLEAARHKDGPPQRQRATKTAG